MLAIHAARSSLGSGLYRGTHVRIIQASDDLLDQGFQLFVGELSGLVFLEDGGLGELVVREVLATICGVDLGGFLALFTSRAITLRMSSSLASCFAPLTSSIWIADSSMRRVPVRCLSLAFIAPLRSSRIFIFMVFSIRTGTMRA